ncbi:MAG: glycine/sarcosine/betaine reductase component B subunit [Desulfobulbaceae bacterium]|nr:glycine/sarcosine/betaine reductase component B subunit [Desulfobulbaceae bacterium]
MALTLSRILINEVVFGEKTEVRNHILFIEQQKLRDFLQLADDRIAAINIALARPQESCRIICVKDVIEPRIKIKGDKPGEGEIQILSNVTLVTCGKIVGFQEGIIDMSGPGAAHSPFGQTLNVVLEIEVVPHLEPHLHEEVMRQAGHRAAAFLAEAAKGVAADHSETLLPITPNDASAQLPRVVYVYMLLTQGLLHDTYVFGKNANSGLPIALPPHLLFDEVVTSGNCVSACDKNTTFHHQNNPLLAELFRRHNHDLNLVGVILTDEPVRLAGKQASAIKAVELAQSLGAQAAVISKEGFGNPDADQMMLIRGLEQAGIKTAALTDEYAGPDGASQSLADSTPEADAMVSTGNANARITLPAMARTIGPIQDLSKLAGAYPQSLKEDGSLEIELQGLIGATNQLGLQKLRAVER